jgi:hypothetical protein
MATTSSCARQTTPQRHSSRRSLAAPEAKGLPRSGHQDQGCPASPAIPGTGQAGPHREPRRGPTPHDPQVIGASWDLGRGQPIAHGPVPGTVSSLVQQVQGDRVGQAVHPSGSHQVGRRRVRPSSGPPVDRADHSCADRQDPHRCQLRIDRPPLRHAPVRAAPPTARPHREPVLFAGCHPGCRSQQRRAARHRENVLPPTGVPPVASVDRPCTRPTAGERVVPRRTRRAAWAAWLSARLNELPGQEVATAPPQPQSSQGQGQGRSRDQRPRSRGRAGRWRHSWKVVSERSGGTRWSAGRRPGTALAGAARTSWPARLPGVGDGSGLLWDGYDPVRDTQSALAAVDAPTGWS